jgi:hypothetical protein
MARESIGVVGRASPHVGVGRREHDVVGIGPVVVQAFPNATRASVTSASVRPTLCTLRYSSALLPKSFERPGPKSVSPAMYCSGVRVVV